jgi:hypothetical protein
MYTNLPKGAACGLVTKTVSMPSTTRPNAPCRPSSHGASSKVMKNWDPLVLGPAFDQWAPFLFLLFYAIPTFQTITIWLYIRISYIPKLLKDPKFLYV